MYALILWFTSQIYLKTNKFMTCSLLLPQLKAAQSRSITKHLWAGRFSEKKYLETSFRGVCYISGMMLDDATAASTPSSPFKSAAESQRSRFFGGFKLRRRKFRAAMKGRCNQGCPPWIQHVTINEYRRDDWRGGGVLLTQRDRSKWPGTRGEHFTKDM